jgi:hypothetical protein
MRPQRTPPLQSRFGRYGSQETLAIARSAPIATVFVMGERGFSGSMVIGGGIRTSRPIQDPRTSSRLRLMVGPDTAKAFPNAGANASVVAASVVAALTTWRFEPVYVDLQTPHLGIEGARGETEFDGGA